MFNPANRKLKDYFNELQKLAKDEFVFAAPAIIEQLINAKMPPHLKKSINQAHLENGTYEQLESRSGWELELNGLEAPDVLQTSTVTKFATKLHAEEPKPTNHYCKKQYRAQGRQLREKKTKLKAKRIVLAVTMILTVPKQPLTLTAKMTIIVLLTTQTTEMTENRKLSNHPVRPVAKPTIPL